MMQWLEIWNWYSKLKYLKARKFSLAASIPEHAVEKPENIMFGHENELEMMLKQVAGGEPVAITFPALNDWFFKVAGSWTQSPKNLLI